MASPVSIRHKRTQTARSATAAVPPLRAAGAAAPLRRLPPRPRSRGVSHLSRRVSAPKSRSRAVAIPRRAAPLHSHRRTGAAAAASGGGDGQGSDSDSSDSDSDSSDDEDEEMGARAAGGEEDASDEGGDEESEPRDYRTIGSEIYDGGDLEAGESLRGMYDFVDDMVETQHVPTIRDPFDTRGRFHRRERGCWR